MHKYLDEINTKRLDHVNYIRMEMPKVACLCEAKLSWDEFDGRVLGWLR